MLVASLNSTQLDRNECNRTETQFNAVSEKVTALRSGGTVERRRDVIWATCPRMGMAQGGYTHGDDAGFAAHVLREV
jgi:hypothetical protein